jgi:catechol 2,3-dioxygenase-like lactoylglutathione lyase family enzyme
MVSTLDHIIVAVKNLDIAKSNYEKIFGLPPAWRGKHPELGTSNVLFNFENTYFELLASTGNGLGAELVEKHINEKGEGLFGLVMGTDDIVFLRKKISDSGFSLPDLISDKGIDDHTGEKRTWINQFFPYEMSRGLFSFIIQHKTGVLPSVNSYPESAIHRLDHAVIQTNDADGFIKIYRDVFGIRLALDKFIGAWKKRMLFFRLNKTTIEVIEESDSNLDSHDTLWGVAWQVKDIHKTRKRLLKNNIDVSEIKDGIKDGTLVATLKSHNHNVPTLLIESKI